VQVKKFKLNLIETDTSIRSLEENNIRLYSTPGGIFPSVTTVVGWDKRLFFESWRIKNKQESERVCTRGTNLHSLVENYIMGKEVNLNNLDYKTQDLFHLIKPKVDELDEIYALETPLWSTKLGLAGRVDCIGIYEGKIQVIDFKGSTRPKDIRDIQNYFLQATAYCLMWQERTGEKVKDFSIFLASEEGIMQVFTEKTVNFVSDLKKAIDNFKEVKNDTIEIG
jgi:genome maintenance exonuclease 1